MGSFLCHLSAGRFHALHGTAGCSTQLTSRIRRRQSGPTFALLGSSFHTFLPFFRAHFNLLSLVNEEVHTRLSLSLRSLARVGASVAVLSASTTGSSLALRGLTRGLHPSGAESRHVQPVRCGFIKIRMKVVNFTKKNSSKTTFIKNHFHQKPFSSKSTFIKNHIHQQPPKRTKPPN